MDRMHCESRKPNQVSHFPKLYRIALRYSYLAFLTLFFTEEGAERDSHGSNGGFGGASNQETNNGFGGGGGFGNSGGNSGFGAKPSSGGYSGFGGSGGNSGFGGGGGFGGSGKGFIFLKKYRRVKYPTNTYRRAVISSPPFAKFAYRVGF